MLLGKAGFYPQNSYFELPLCFILSFRSWVKTHTHTNLAVWHCCSIFFYSFSHKIRPLSSICPLSLSLLNCVTVPKSVGVLFTTEKSLICAVTLSVAVFAHSAGCPQPFRWFGITTVWSDLMSTSHSESLKILLWAETVSALHVKHSDHERHPAFALEVLGLSTSAEKMLWLQKYRQPITSKVQPN